MSRISVPMRRGTLSLDFNQETGALTICAQDPSGKGLSEITLEKPARVQQGDIPTKPSPQNVLYNLFRQFSEAIRDYPSLDIAKKATPDLSAVEGIIMGIPSSKDGHGIILSVRGDTLSLEIKGQNDHRKESKTPVSVDLWPPADERSYNNHALEDLVRGLVHFMA